MPRYSLIIVFDADNDEDAKEQVEEGVDIVMFNLVSENLLTNDKGDTVER